MQLDKSKNIVIGAIVLIVLIIFAWYLYGSSVLNNKNNVAKIEITNCSSIAPTFFSTQKDKAVYLINSDSKEHIIKIADNELSIGAGEEKILSAEFIYGAGTYAYDCDSIVNAGQIQIVAPEQDLKDAGQTFKEIYDSLPKELQGCAKKSLSGKFEKIYNGQEGFVLNSDDIEAINSCLILLQPPQQ